MIKTILLGCGLLSCLAAEQPTDTQQAVIHMDVNLILSPASVRDRSGHFVSGLDQQNFQLFVDGTPQPIKTFESDDAPVAAGILVDNSASMTRKGEEVLAAALAFARESNSQDEMFVVHFSNEIRLGLPMDQAFTGKISELESALSRFSAEGTTSLYDAVALGISQFQRTKMERKVLLIISDGGDNSSRQHFNEVVESAQKAGIQIYCVGIYDDHDRDRNPRVLTQFAEITGGKAFFPSQLNHVTSTCIKIARDIREQYTLGFEGKTDGGFHRIKIIARGPDSTELDVRTRSGYFAPKP